jgi:hypothetical protein
MNAESHCGDAGRGRVTRNAVCSFSRAVSIRCSSTSTSFRVGAHPSNASIAVAASGARNSRAPPSRAADWTDLDEAAAAAGTDRAKLIVAFIRWYLHRPGAELPERPRSGT